MTKRSPKELTTLKFPDCARYCAVVGLLGVSECESVCPEKEETISDDFKDK